MIMATTFFTIEIYYTAEGETGRHVLRNFTAKKLMEFREIVFSVGLMIPQTWDDPNDKEFSGLYEIVPPWNIKTIEVFIQKKFFYDNNKKS